MERRIIKIEQDLTVLSTTVSEIKNSISKIDKSLQILVSLQTDTKLLEQQVQTIKENNEDAHERIHKRIDKLDGTVTWVARIIIRALLTGGIGILFFVLKKAL